MLTSGSNDFCITLVNQICCTKLTLLAESRVPAGWYSMEILESCGGLGDHHSKDPEAEQTRTTRTPAFWGYPRRLDPKSKEDKVKVTNLKNSPKFQIFEFWNGHYTRHTFWSCLIRCANMKWIRWVLLKIQSWHDSVHRRTDGQGDTSIPLSTSLKRGV